MMGAAKGRYQRKVAETYNKTQDYHQDQIVHHVEGRHGGSSEWKVSKGGV